jgi:hypothetical protein
MKPYPRHPRPLDHLDHALVDVEAVAAGAHEKRARWAARVQQLQAEGFTCRLAWEIAELEVYGRASPAWTGR